MLRRRAVSDTLGRTLHKRTGYAPSAHDLRTTSTTAYLGARSLIWANPSEIDSAVTTLKPSDLSLAQGAASSDHRFTQSTSNE